MGHRPVVPHDEVLALPQGDGAVEFIFPVMGDIGLVQFFPVDVRDALDDLQGIPRHADDPLDAQMIRPRVGTDDDATLPGALDLHVDDGGGDAIAVLQGIQHGSTIHPNHGEEELANDEHDDQGDQDGLDPLPDLLFHVDFFLLGRGFRSWFHGALRLPLFHHGPGIFLS